jgi:plasmid stabilization system protein ParE
MIQKVTWLPIAQSTFTDTLLYLEENFGTIEMRKFEDTVVQKIELQKTILN